MEHQTHAPATPPIPTPLQAAATTLAVVVIVAFYIVLGTVLHVPALYMGFVFSTYWGAIRMLALPDFLPSVLGGLFGIGLAYLFLALPPAFGPAAVAIPLVATIAGIYFMVRQQGQIFINPAYLVFITVATIPALGKQQIDFANMVIGMLFGAAYAGLIVVALRQPKPAQA